MIAVLVADFEVCTRVAPRAVSAILGPFLAGAEGRVVVATADGPALVLQRSGHTAAQWRGLVVVLATLTPAPMRCYAVTKGGTWRRVSYSPWPRVAA